MVNLSDELSELSYNELQYVIKSYLLWAYNTMKQRGINIRSRKAWRCQLLWIIFGDNIYNF